MITVNDKLKLFTKRIIDRQQEAYDDKVDALESKMVEELKERKQMLEKDRKKYEQSLLKGVVNEKAQRLSNARSEQKRRLLLKRKEMIDELLDGVRDYTTAFVDSENYLEYLNQIIEKNIEMIKGLGSFVLFVSEKDYAKKAEIQALFKAHELSCLATQPLKKRMIGGFILVREDRTSRLDFTLDAVIEDNKKYMGQLIYNMLEEAGEFSGKQS